MGRFGGNSCRLILMIGFTGTYFFVELIVGTVVGSVSLTADSFHMLSDVMALFVGLAAVRISRWPRSSKNTYGWQRAEVLGTLVNTVMLVTLCFTIVVRAIHRFFEPESIKDPELMIYVGAGGLLINVVGLLMFCGHGHHHGHSHLVDESQQGHLITNSESNDDHDEVSENEDTGTLMNPAVAIPVDNVANPPDGEQTDQPAGETVVVPANEQRAGHMNIKAVFLHIMADALGSVIVMITALVLKFVPGDPDLPKNKWKLYLDPLLSCILVCVILSSAVPLLMRSGLILLQCVPKEVKVRELKKELEKVEGIYKVHDLHIWQLQSNCFIGTVHLRCRDLNEYIKVSRSAKKVFHNFNIHCTTIQPEFEEHIGEDSEGLNSGGPTPLPNGGSCVLDCGPRQQCKRDICCPTKSPKTAHNHDSNRPSPRTVRALDPEAQHEDEPVALRSEEDHLSETNLDE